MLTELTYISAVQQDPREIHNAPISNTHKEKYYSFKLLRVDLEKLLMNIHVGEWETTETRETRYTFSELLELTQRSWQLGKQATGFRVPILIGGIGPRTARAVRLRIQNRIWNTRRWDLDPARWAGLHLFRRRPSANRRFQKYYDVSLMTTALH